MRKLIGFIWIVFSLNTISSQNNHNIKNIIEEFNYSKDSFFIGASLNHFQLNTEIEKIFLKEFNYLTPANSFKQTVIHPKPDVWRWNRYNDFINFANENN